jgi:hypothetical protein
VEVKMGSSGGGSSSGAISYPTYMTGFHADWLAEVQADVHLITKNGNDRNPFYNISCFEPLKYLEAIGLQATKDLVRVDTFYPGTVFGTVYNASKLRIEDMPPYKSAADGIDTLETQITDITPTTKWSEVVDLVKEEIDADTDYDAIITALSDFKTALTSFTAGTTWTEDAGTVKTEIDKFESNENYHDDALAYAKILEDNITNSVIPKFKSGMRDVNAAMGSAFVVGQSHIWGMMDRDVAKYLAGLREKNIGYRYELFKSGLDQLIKMHELELGTHGVEIAQKLALFTKKWEINVSNIAEVLKLINAKIEHLKNKSAVANQLFGVYVDTMDKNNFEILNNEFRYLDEYRKSVNLLVDIDKIIMVAEKEKITEQAALRESEWLWNLKLYQYYGNLLASIGSGTAVNYPSEANRTKTAIGTMVSGAGIGGFIGAGTAVGGPVGAGIGAVLGLGLGLLG